MTSSFRIESPAMKIVNAGAAAGGFVVAQPASANVAAKRSVEAADLKFKVVTSQKLAISRRRKKPKAMGAA